MQSEDAQVLALKAAIQQRDSLLRIINGEPDTGESIVSDNARAPLATRLRNLQKQLRERDRLLEDAGSAADRILQATPRARSISLLDAQPPTTAAQTKADHGASDRLVHLEISRHYYLRIYVCVCSAYEYSTLHGYVIR